MILFIKFKLILVKKFI